MRNAPSVMYPVGRCAFYARLLAGLGLLGLLGLAAGAWGARAPSGIMQFLAGGVLWLLWLGFVVWSWRRTPVGQLHWDAQSQGVVPESKPGAWRWRSEAHQEVDMLQRVELLLDLQRLVLIRLRHPDGATSWVWAEKARDPARWDDLRRALVSNR
jgi:hypothetical protein